MDLNRQLADPRRTEAFDLRPTRRLLVTFGSLRVDGGPMMWNFVRATSGMTDARVFLRDHRMAWYQRGTREHPSVTALTAFLADVSARYAEVLFAGSSMGGYAALQYGRAVGVDVYVVNPQTSLRIERAQDYPDPRQHLSLDALLADLPADAVIDLATTTQARGTSTIVYAAQSPIDVAHAENMAGRATLIPRDCDHHLLVKQLTASGEIAAVLRG